MYKTMIAVSCIAVMGCSNAPLGVSVAQLKQEQTYNLKASEENKDVLPPATGTRSQVAYEIYAGTSDKGLAGSVIENIGD